MTISVSWIEKDITEVTEIKIATVAGILSIFQCDNRITKTAWCFETASIITSENLLAKEIQAYFNHEISSLSLNLQKQGTHYRNTVWAEISNIPVGQVNPYSQLAKKLNSGARAVANACRDNPFPGIIPCHRVVSIAGLGGYMGHTSGPFLAIKKKLLAMESS